MSSIPVRYEVLHQLLEPVNLRRVHLVLPVDIIKLSNFAPRKPPHVGKLSFEMVIGSPDGTQVGIVAEILQTEPALLRLHKRLNSKAVQEQSDESKTDATLTTLQLACGMRGWKEAEALSEALKTDSTLVSLNLHDNAVGEKGAQALSEALKINSTLTFLDIDSNSIRDKGERHFLGYSRTTRRWPLWT